MYYETVIASDIAKLETQLVERRAAEWWRFRHRKKSKSKVLMAVVTNVLQLFLR